MFNRFFSTLLSVVVVLWLSLCDTAVAQSTKSEAQSVSAKTTTGDSAKAEGQKLDAAGTVPLVLHGGSGTPDDQVRAAVENGICKFNVYTDSRVALWRRFRQLATDITRQDPLPKDYIAALQEALGDIVEEKSRLAGVVGKSL